MPQQREQSYFATINSLANLQINFFDKHTPPTRHRSKEDIVAGYFQTYGLLPPHINGWPLPPFTLTINSPKFPPHIEPYLTFPPALEHFTLSKKKKNTKTPAPPGKKHKTTKNINQKKKNNFFVILIL